MGRRWFDGEMPAPHVHACAECDPTLKPSEVRQSDQHFGVQFGHRKHRVFLNGELDENGYETMAGEEGWLLRFCLDETGRRHLCPHTDSGVCAERVYGNVRVEEKVSA